MIAALLDHDVVAGLLRTLWFGVPLVALVAAVARLIPGLPAAARVAAWWLVTLRLALWLVPVPTVPIAVLPAPEARVTATGADTLPLRSPQGGRHDVRDAAAVTSVAAVPRSWVRAVAAAWGGGLVAIGLVSLVRLRRARAVVRGAAAAPDGLRLRATALASRMGLHRAPEVRVSAGIATPQVSGLLHPVILLPERAAAALERDDLDMVLCHELLHVRRRDLWLGLVPAAARWLLWFNPAAQFAAREYLLAREAACDAEVLDLLGVEPRRYGHLLLSFGASRAALGGAAAGGSFTTLKRRLTMLDSKTRSSRRRRAGWAMPACAAFALVPISLVARPASAPHAAATVALAVEQPSEAPAPAAPTHAPAHAPAHAEAPQHSTIHVSVHDRVSWVLFEEGSDEVHMSGSTGDVSAARAARRGREALLWMRSDDRRYAIRDKAAMGRVRALFEPMEQLGGRQAALGAQQAAIGAKMAAVGQQQAEIGTRQAALGTRQAAIGARQAAEASKIAGSAGKEEAASEASLKALESQMEALGTQMDALGQQMEALSEPMEDLSKQMEPLAAEQEKLGAEMEDLAERATADLERFLDETVRNGTAVEIK